MLKKRIEKIANKLLCGISRCIESRAQEVIIPLYSELLISQLEYYVQFGAPCFKKDIDRMCSEEGN